MNATKEVPNIDIRRCFIDNRDIKEIQLVGFSDPLKTGYAAYIYVQSEYTNDSKSSEILISKTRIALLVEQSIPQFELFVTLILTRITKKIIEVL